MDSFSKQLLGAYHVPSTVHDRMKALVHQGIGIHMVVRRCSTKDGGHQFRTQDLRAAVSSGWGDGYASQVQDCWAGHEKLGKLNVEK